jgi:hypothetical protein
LATQRFVPFVEAEEGPWWLASAEVVEHHPGEVSGDDLTGELDARGSETTSHLHHQDYGDFSYSFGLSSPSLQDPAQLPQQPDRPDDPGGGEIVVVRDVEEVVYSAGGAEVVDLSGGGEVVDFRDVSNDTSFPSFSSASIAFVSPILPDLAYFGVNLLDHLASSEVREDNHFAPSDVVHGGLTNLPQQTLSGYTIRTRDDHPSFAAGWSHGAMTALTGDIHVDSTEGSFLLNENVGFYHAGYQVS